MRSIWGHTAVDTAAIGRVGSPARRIGRRTRVDQHGPHRHHRARHRRQPRHRPRAHARRSPPRPLRLVLAGVRDPDAFEPIDGRPPGPHGPLEPRVDRRVRRRRSTEPVDLLINNAGQMTGGLLEEQDMDAVYAMFQVNLVGGRAPDQPPAAGHARARPRHDRQQRLDQRLRVLPRRQHLRRVEGRRGRADRVAAARARRHRRAARCTSSRPASTPTCSTPPRRSTAATWTPRAGTRSSRTSGPTRCSPPSRRTSRIVGPGGKLAYAKLASRGPAFLLDALSGRMFSRQPRR